ncbi:MAG: rhodanese-like domain-containing protein [Bacteroidia bacterium]
MKFSKLFFSLMTAGMLLASCSNSQGQSYKNVDVNKAQEIISSAENVVVLDVRTPQEFSEGHMENAVNIDIYSSDFEAQLAQLDKSKTYVVVCRSGGRSAKASDKMTSMGFESVNNMEGGFTAWAGAGKPSVK